MLVTDKEILDYVKGLTVKDAQGLKDLMLQRIKEEYIRLIPHAEPIGLQTSYQIEDATPLEDLYVSGDDFIVLLEAVSDRALEREINIPLYRFLQEL